MIGPISQLAAFISGAELTEGGVGGAGVGGVGGGVATTVLSGVTVELGLPEPPPPQELSIIKKEAEAKL